MGVYVDEAIWPWRGALWCHLVADTDGELETIARELGLRRRWRQHKPARPWLDHYDLPAPIREAALRAGAQAVSRAELVAVIRAKRTAMRAEAAGDAAPDR